MTISADRRPSDDTCYVLMRWQAKDGGSAMALVDKPDPPLFYARAYLFSLHYVNILF